MPMINLQCLNQHRDEAFLHHWADHGCRTRLCWCGEALAPAFSAGRGLTYFEEGRARYIENLGGVWVTSHEQHKRLMKERGVEPAIGFQTSTKGTGWAHHLKASEPKDAPLIMPDTGGIL